MPLLKFCLFATILLVAVHHAFSQFGPAIGQQEAESSASIESISTIGLKFDNKFGGQQTNGLKRAIEKLKNDGHWRAKRGNQSPKNSATRTTCNFTAKSQTLDGKVTEVVAGMFECPLRSSNQCVSGFCLFTNGEKFWANYCGPCEQIYIIVREILQTMKETTKGPCTCSEGGEGSGGLPPTNGSLAPTNGTSARTNGTLAPTNGTLAPTNGNSAATSNLFAMPLIAGVLVAFFIGTFSL